MSWIFEPHGGFGRTIAGETMPFGYISEGVGQPIFELDHPGIGRPDYAKMIAAATMIAAAPELYEALTKARNTLAGCGMANIAADICDAALAKAASA